MKRRQFMKRMMGGAAASATTMSGGRVAGANDRVRVGLIGCGGRGSAVAGADATNLHLKIFIE